MMKLKDLEYPLDTIPDGQFDIYDIMPDYNELPEEFKSGQTQWNDLFNYWIFGQLDELTLTPKEGVVKSKALTHIYSIMTSRANKHEHKEAAIAWLLNNWFCHIQFRIKKDSKLVEIPT